MLCRVVLFRFTIRVGGLLLTSTVVRWVFVWFVFVFLSCQAPETDTFSMVFTGIYALVGVPLYAAALGSFAGIIVERYERLVMRVWHAALSLRGRRGTH